MAPVRRKAGAPMSSTNTRGVLCANAPAKPVGKLLRKVLEPAMATEVEGLQFGAIAGGGTVFPVHTAKLFFAQARLAGLSSAILFGDLKAAFYSAWPEVVLGQVLLPEQRQAIFDGAGLSPQQAAEVNACIGSGDTETPAPCRQGEARHLPAHVRRAAASGHL